MQKIKLILVDDHQLFIDGLTAILSKELDFEIVATFLDANKALDKIDIYDVDLVITDISMPNMNGIEFINLLKKKKPELKILIASSFEQLISSKMVCGYISKNSDSRDFIKAIREIVIHEKKFFKEESTIKVNQINRNNLTKREKEIVSLIAQEKTVNEIAESLFLSRTTIETHKKNIFLKLSVKSNAGLVKKAFFLGVIN